MRQVVYRRFGDPGEVLDLEDVVAPVPLPGEVVIALEAAPIHLADLKHVRGLPWFDQYTPPYTPGYEGVGRISAVGRDVTRWKEGDRAFLPARFGAWREQVRVDAATLWAAPERVPAEQLALVPINLPTAYLLLRSVVAMRAGDWVLQNAANSNVGHYLIRLAKRIGLATVNVVRRAELLPALASAGGDLNLLDGNDLADRVMATVPSGALKLAIDAIAGDAPTRLGRCFGNAGGTVVSFGLLSGEPCRIPPEMLMLDEVTLTGFYMTRTLSRMAPSALAAMQDDINDFLVSQPPDAPIAGVYRFADVREAVRRAALVGAEREGKIILTP